LVLFSKIWEGNSSFFTALDSLVLGTKPHPIDWSSFLSLFYHQDWLRVTLSMKSCRLAPFSYLSVFFHVILKSISDLIGSQVAQFCFLSFVDVMFLKKWIKVASSRLRYFVFWLSVTEPTDSSCEKGHCCMAQLSIVICILVFPLYLTECLPCARGCALCF
jgi:hypothetical protein